jgi:hypothetical protein
MILTKVISGCQTGADQGALYAAKELGLKTGGWMPRGYRTDEGPRWDLAELYGMVYTHSEQYPARTLSNVLHGDGTLIFGNPRSRGCSLTKLYTTRANKPLYTVLWPSAHYIVEDYEFLNWLVSNSISILNVAGNRERLRPGINAAVQQYLTWAITELRKQEEISYAP